MSSYLITSENVQLALKNIQPAIENLVNHQVTAKTAVNAVIVVLDPSKPFGSCTFEEAILSELTLGTPNSGTDDVAKAKAKICWRTGKDSFEVQQIAPHLLEWGDIKYGGGVCLQGLIVSCSGFEDWADVLISRWMADMLIAFATKQMRIIIPDSKMKFLGFEVPG
jgi:hypothetical protein